MYLSHSLFLIYMIVTSTRRVKSLKLGDFFHFLILLVFRIRTLNNQFYDLRWRRSLKRMRLVLLRKNTKVFEVPQRRRSKAKKTNWTRKLLLKVQRNAPAFKNTKVDSRSSRPMVCSRVQTCPGSPWLRKEREEILDRTDGFLTK